MRDTPRNGTVRRAFGWLPWVTTPPTYLVIRDAIINEELVDHGTQQQRK
jgi:hypothetical protein